MVKLAAVLAVPLALLATVASLGVVVVDVQEGGPDGHRIMVPVPLVFAQAALAAGPIVAEEELRIPDEALEHIGIAREILDALAAAPDGVLVHVQEPDEEVIIRKVGDKLVVRVHGNEEEVSVNVPLSLARSALPDSDGRISTVAMAGSLGGVRFTDLVEVHDGNDHVRIWVW
ncbi:MAG: hypothetical protein PVJ73_09860 [Acidobacteriota bacterium]|jgi:hypothetical protein|nr:hypothetical protein [Acidobacteriota bacterium]